MIGHLAMDELEIQPIPVEQRRGREAVAVFEGTIFGLEIQLPNFVAVRIEAGQIAGTHQRPNMLAVRDGGGRAQVAFVPHDVAIAVPDHFSPHLFAIGADADQKQLLRLSRRPPPKSAAPAPRLTRALPWQRVLLRTREINVVVPHNGCRASRPRQRQAPGEVERFIEFCRKLFLVTDAVVVRPAPLRPIIGSHRRRKRSACHNCKN